MLVVLSFIVSIGRGWVFGGIYVLCFSGFEWVVYVFCIFVEIGGYRGLW